MLLDLASVLEIAVPAEDRRPAPAKHAGAKHAGADVSQCTIQPKVIFCTLFDDQKLRNDDKSKQADRHSLPGTSAVSRWSIDYGANGFALAISKRHERARHIFARSQPSASDTQLERLLVLTNPSSL
jgi:hypothetical protein